jgi:plasmid stabilization system protein ParE
MAHIVSEVASAELEDIWYYFAKQSGSTERADWMLDPITERCYNLSAYPRIGRKRPALRPGLRSFNVCNYTMIYRIEAAEDALILHVFDGRQDIQARL